MKVLVDACRNEFKGTDVNGRLYRVPGTSGRRGTQRTSALADTMAGRKASRGRNDLDSTPENAVVPAIGMWGNHDDYWTDTRTR